MCTYIYHAYAQKAAQYCKFTVLTVAQHRTPELEAATCGRFTKRPSIAQFALDYISFGRMCNLWFDF